MAGESSTTQNIMANVSRDGDSEYATPDSEDASHEKVSLKASESQQIPPGQVEPPPKLRNGSDAAASASQPPHKSDNIFSHPLASHFGYQEFAAQNIHLLDPGSLVSPMPPLFYPPLCGFVPVPAHDQLLQHGGLFAVPYFPYAGPMTFFPPGGLVPLCYNAPLGVAAASQQPGLTISQSTNSTSIERGAVLEGQEIEAQGLRQRHAAAAPAGQAQEDQPQRQVIRRFRVGIQLDLLLILKLAVVVFFFSQDGSKDRLLLLLFLAAVIYMYQTGALTPILRWISTNVQRLVMPPQVIRHAPNNQAQQERAENGVGNAAAIEENARDVGAADGLRNEHPNVEPAEGGAVVPGAALPAPGDQHLAQGQRWWGFLKEIQILVVGFVTSLLPGFQNPE